MKIKFIIISLFALAGMLEAQQVKDSPSKKPESKSDACLRFAKGTFQNVSDKDSLSSIIIRKGNKQVEIMGDRRVYKTIRWIDDCDYNLFYDGKEAKEDPFFKKINKMGGLMIVPSQIIDNKMYYNLWIPNQDANRRQKTLDAGLWKSSVSGKLIKISSNTDFNQSVSNLKTSDDTIKN